MRRQPTHGGGVRCSPTSCSPYWPGRSAGRAITLVKSRRKMWPPSETTHQRLTGVYTRAVVRTQAQWREVMGTLEAFAAEETIPCSRMSIRVVVDERFLARQTEDIRRFGEVRLPLRGGLAMVYLGWNRSGRSTDDQDVRRAFANLEAARSTALPFELLTRMERQNIHIRVLTLAERTGDAELLAGVHAIWGPTFGWSLETCKAALASPADVVAVALDEGKVVSISSLENSTFAFDDGFTLRMGEMTNAGTQETHQRRGFSSALRMALVPAAAGLMRSGELDVMFGEATGLAPGALKLAARFEVTFTYPDERGLPFLGYLPQHAAIAGQPKSTRYNDLFVTFATLESFTQLLARSKL